MDKDSLKRDGVMLGEESFLLKVSQDGMQALLIPGKENPALADMMTLWQALEENGIISGLLPRPVLNEDGSYAVALGTAPVAGENARLRFHVKPSVVRMPKEKDPEKGDAVDYRELGGLVNVKAGQLLLEKIPLTAGIAGLDVFGREVAAKQGHDLKMKFGDNVCFNEEDGLLFATANGKFLMLDEKASVSEEHLISEDVDKSTGNVAFGGRSLEIYGAVVPGFKVRCRGEISIGRGINNAEILAGGNITIQGGVVGPHANVTSMGDVAIDFIENGPRIRASGDLLLKNAAIQADIEIGGSLKAVDGKGLVVGGKYVVGGSAWVKELGSEGEVVTDITVGIKPSLERQKERLARDREIWPVRMSETLKNINGLNKLKKDAGGKLDDDKQQLLDKYNAFLPKVMEKVNQLTEQDEAINAEIVQSAHECIYVLGHLHPGVRVRIGNALRVVSDLEERVTVRLNQKSRQIVIQGMSADGLAKFES